MNIRQEVKDTFGTIKKCIEETSVTMYEIRCAEKGDKKRLKSIRDAIKSRKGGSFEIWTPELTERVKKEILKLHPTISDFCDEHKLNYYSVLDVLRGNRDRISGLSKELLTILKIK